MTKNDKIKAIKEIIQRDGLGTKCRKQVNNMRRRYLMASLRALDMPYKVVGEMFNRDHATVIHNIRQHNWSIESGDSYYITVIQDDINELNGVADVKYRRYLKDDILKCKSYNELKAIKRRVMYNKYQELL